MTQKTQITLNLKKVPNYLSGSYAVNLLPLTYTLCSPNDHKSDDEINFLLLTNLIPLFSGFVGNQNVGCSNRPGICPDGTECDENAECIKPLGNYNID